MVEIFGGHLEKAFDELGIAAVKTYQQTKGFEYQGIHQVWELNDADFKSICDIKEEDWHDDWGWWRSVIGSVMAEPTDTIIINDKEILAWYNEARCLDYIDFFGDDIAECDPNMSMADIEEKLSNDYIGNLEYDNLLEYFCEEHGVSQPRNVCALAVDLAKMNNMKMSELFQKYQG